MQATQDQEQGIKTVNKVAAIAGIIVITAQAFTLISNASDKVYFAVGILMLIVAFMWTALAFARTILQAKGLQGAAIAWFVGGLWFVNGLLQFGHVAFSH